MNTFLYKVNHKNTQFFLSKPLISFITFKKVCEYDQEMPQSHATD